MRFPVSANPEVFDVQKTLVEAWSIVGRAYVDPAFNGRDWEDELGQYMGRAVESPNHEQAYRQIKGMLAELEDPYTRILPPREYRDFRSSSQGELDGVGLVAATDGEDGSVVVLACIEGSPAEKAGILPGDELVGINGASVKGLTGSGVAQQLRGQSGTSVALKLARGEGKRREVRTVLLQRQSLSLSPVLAAEVDSRSGRRYGYIWLTSFSKGAAADTAAAIQKLEQAGVQGFILDLRQNGGGLVNRSIDLASLFLDGPRIVFHVTAREVAPSPQPVALPEHSSLTNKPLAVLVDGSSASASEILAGALRDNRRAQVIGERTLGKGKIQSVFELQDGSALFVTVAKFYTPSRSAIDQTGIVPDRSCVSFPQSPPPEQDAKPARPPILANTSNGRYQRPIDACIAAAERSLDLQG